MSLNIPPPPSAWTPNPPPPSAWTTNPPSAGTPSQPSAAAASSASAAASEPVMSVNVSGAEMLLDVLDHLKRVDRGLLDNDEMMMKVSHLSLRLKAFVKRHGPTTAVEAGAAAAGASAGK